MCGQLKRCFSGGAKWISCHLTKPCWRCPIAIRSVSVEGLVQYHGISLVSVSAYFCRHISPDCYDHRPASKHLNHSRCMQRLASLFRFFCNDSTPGPVSPTLIPSRACRVIHYSLTTWQLMAVDPVKLSRARTSSAPASPTDRSIHLSANTLSSCSGDALKNHNASWNQYAVDNTALRQAKCSYSSRELPHPHDDVLSDASSTPEENVARRQSAMSSQSPALPSLVSDTIQRPQPGADEATSCARLIWESFCFARSRDPRWSETMEMTSPDECATSSAADADAASRSANLFVYLPV